ncbi:putative lipid II flippase FtsW [Gordonia zhaorongruii]|uniref:putative lipid II flippase FtsW n=1 Tax=Gordonia zhaorongruii TaxID=2597659 RepID=UPI0014049D53
MSAGSRRRRSGDDEDPENSDLENSDLEKDDLENFVEVDLDEEPDVDRRRSRTPQRRRPQGLNLSMPSIDVRATVSTVREGFSTLLSRPLASFHMILSLTVILTALGLIMVLSASSVEGYAKDGSAYGMFATQATFATLGFILFYLTLKVPVRLFRRFATVGIGLSILLLTLVLVPGIGVMVNGARRWFSIAGLSVQPSELVKVALCVWGAHLLASRRNVGVYGKELLMPLVPVSIVVCVLIILEPNQSTTMIIALIVAALLWFAGLPGRVFAGFILVFLAAGVALALMSDYRSARVFSFLGRADDPLGSGYQAMQAQFALANGGVFGVGLGQSTAKWNYLPNAHNDFIFAIIGEELGLIGALIVVGLFVILGAVGMRIARRSLDPFFRLLAATITVLFLVQAFINIGYVVGLLPVTGIQLPILSNGGTSMLTMLTMLGLLATAARHEPDAIRALTGPQPNGLSRFLRLPTPVAYRPPRAEVLRDRLERKRPAGGRSAGRRPAPVRVPRARGTGRGSAPVRTGAVRSGEIHYPGRQPRPRRVGQRSSWTQDDAYPRSTRGRQSWRSEGEYRRR